MRGIWPFELFVAVRYLLARRKQATGLANGRKT